MNNIGRVKAKYYNLQAETISEVFDRIEIEANLFVQWEDILEFFTKRGRSLEILKKLSRQ